MNLADLVFHVAVFVVELQRLVNSDVGVIDSVEFQRVALLT